jgi:hypothetical protein
MLVLLLLVHQKWHFGHWLGFQNVLPPIGNNCRWFCTNLISAKFIVNTDIYFQSKGVSFIITSFYCDISRGNCTIHTQTCILGAVSYNFLQNVVPWYTTLYWTCMDHTTPLRNCHVSAQVLMWVCWEPPEEFQICNHSFVLASSLLSTQTRWKQRHNPRVGRRRRRRVCCQRRRRGRQVRWRRRRRHRGRRWLGPRRVGCRCVVRWQ